MTEPTYDVVVTREGDDWLAEVPALRGAHTSARTLAALDRFVREVVVLATDRPDEDMPRLNVRYEYRTGEAIIDDTAAEVRRLRAEADELATLAVRRTEAAAEALVAEGYSGRDIAAVLGISPQRVSQLARARAS